MWWIKRILAAGVAVLVLVMGSLGLAYVVLRPRLPQPPTQTACTDLTAYLQEVVDENALPALAVVAVQGDEVVYLAGFGVANLETGEQADAQTVWHWWSMTKPFTAAAILQLVDQGKLGLDDPVSDYLPFFEVNYQGESSVVTIRQLLTHSSGLSDLPPDKLFSYVHYADEPSVNQTDFVTGIFPDLNELQFAPDDDTRYSNLGYMLLGAVIEAVSGESYEDYIRENLLRPLEMTQTDFVYTEEMDGHIAAGAQPLGDPLTLMIPLVVDTDRLINQLENRYLWLNIVYTDYTPSTGLIGSAEDHAKWLMMLLKGGEFRGEQILSPESVEMLWSSDNFKVGQKATYTLGWWVQDGYFEHPGGGPGFGSAMRVYPEQDLGLVIMANSNVYDRDVILDYMSTIDWQGSDCSA